MDKNPTQKIISIATLIVLCVVVLFTYIHYDSYKSTQKVYSDIKNCMNVELDLCIKNILTENKKKAESCTKIYSLNAHNDILKSYTVSSELENDITNPNPDSKLSKILDNVLDKVYVNSDNSSNKPFVVSMDKIIWNRSMVLNNSNNIVINNFINTQYNNVLCREAMDTIRDMNTHKHDFIFWEPISTNTNHKKIKMSIDELLKVYHNEGLNSLKAYDLLVPVYITDTGDIFGTRDLDSIGKIQKNFKLIIIQKVNVYDALKPYGHDIMFFENKISELENDIYISKKQMAKSVQESLIIIIFILVISASLQNKIKMK